MPRNVTVTNEDHIQGNPNAPITLIEYGDYECPHCGYAAPIVKALQDDYADDLRFVFRNFPLTQIHPMAEPAAEAAEFAGSHQRFWEMHDAIYQNQDDLSLTTLYELAHGLNLKQSELRQALEQRTFLPKIQRDFAGGVRAGVNGTPTFFLNGVRHNGTVDVLADAIDAELARQRAA